MRYRSDPWEICSVLQASHREGRSNVANSHPEEQALGSSPIRSTRRQKTKKTLTWSEYDPWEICSVLQASHWEGRSNVANSHPEKQGSREQFDSLHRSPKKQKNTTEIGGVFCLVTRGRIELPFQP